MLVMALIHYAGQILTTKKQVAPREIVMEAVPTASPSATPTAVITPKPLSSAERNRLYGPCVNLPVLMYHHVEREEEAVKNKRTGLNVPPEMFKKQMTYLSENHFTTITPADLVNFFDYANAQELIN